MTTAAEAIVASRFAEALGVLHPAIVHFPVALLVVAALFELFRRRSADTPSKTALILLALGVAAAGASALGGWAAAEGGGLPQATVDLHRWLGVATAAFATAALLAGFLARLSPWWPGFVAYRSLMVTAALGVAVAGHYGGVLVHGEGQLEEAVAILRGRPIRVPAVAPARAEAPSDGPSDDPVAPDGAGMASPEPPSAPAVLTFVDDVRPIFASRCFSCHTGEDAVASLDLDDAVSRRRGGDSMLPAVVPHDVGASHLLSLITSSDPEERMPPKGARLTREEVAIIRTWIEQGAVEAPSATGEPFAGRWPE